MQKKNGKFLKHTTREIVRENDYRHCFIDDFWKFKVLTKKVSLMLFLFHRNEPSQQKQIRDDCQR